MNSSEENLLARLYIENQIGLDVNRDAPFVGIDKYSQRLTIDRFQQHIKRFIQKDNKSNRWLVVPGLRGVGKTTLILQLYKWITEKYNNLEPNLLYIAADAVVELNSNLREMFSIYQSTLGNRFSRVEKPVFIFIDEVQADKNWAKSIKTIYDSSSNVFFICTGSSATHLQMTADVESRRAKVEKMFPLSFVEYQLLGWNVEPNKPLGQKIFQALYYSKDASEVVERLKAIDPEVRQQWTQHNRQSLEKYLKIGTMPLAFNKDIKDVYGSLKQSLNTVINQDLQDYGRNFNAASRLKAQQLMIYLATSGDILTFSKISKLLKINYAQLDSIFGALVQAELLIKVPAWGKSIQNSRRPVRYTFASPALRSAYFDIVGSQAVAGSRRGSLLEDVASLYHYRNLTFELKGELTHYYDSDNQKSADFILKLLDDTNIALEFGLGLKNAKQVETTMAKIKNCKYGLVFSETDLYLHNDSVVFIPLDYFLLL